ncbi:MAG: thioredoxin domain-containing protein [Candidatus Taylorbacteria bacterium]|nr:thioredoxin domain-containing protein [Candidatus Taylorbacteria bacterium]
MTKRITSGALSLPSAIVIAAALIAIAIIFINKPTNTDGTGINRPGENSNKPAASVGIAPVTIDDHILGNPNAPIKLIEYSDLSCPYCKLFNPTLEQIMNTYGPTGKVAWIYRHFPLFKPVDGTIPHPNSLLQAEALECSAKLGGNTSFFAFEKKWFEIFPDDGAGRNATLDREVIDNVARNVGLDPVSFNDCLSSGRFKSKIEKAYDDGLKAGITGTPLTIIVTPSGNQIPLVGSQTYSILKTTIDTLITTIPAGSATTTPAN